MKKIAINRDGLRNFEKRSNFSGVWSGKGSSVFSVVRVAFNRIYGCLEWLYGKTYQFGSDGEAVGDAVFDDGDGFTSPIEGLLAGVFGDVECCDIGCGLSGIFNMICTCFCFYFKINSANSSLTLCVFPNEIFVCVARDSQTFSMVSF